MKELHERLDKIQKLYEYQTSSLFLFVYCGSAKPIQNASCECIRIGGELALMDTPGSVSASAAPKIGCVSRPFNAQRSHPPRSRWQSLLPRRSPLPPSPLPR